MTAHYFSKYVTDGKRPLFPLSLEEATRFIIKRANKLVEELVKGRGREEPPFLAKEYAGLLGIKDIIQADLGEQDALLLRSADGYIIKVNANHSLPRQNFSCAHEIGHTLLDELERQSVADGTEFRGLSLDIHKRAKERLCESAAAELLMPEPVFGKYLTSFGLSVNSIELLAHTFRVARTAAAIRVAEVGVEPCVAVLWKPWQRAKSRGFYPTWARGPGRMWRNKEELPRYVRNPSTLLTAYENDDSVKCFRLFKLGNIQKRCYMESKGFGYDKMRYVISLVFLNRQNKSKSRGNHQ